MCYGRVHNWPPIWLGRFEHDRRLQGEVGLLTHAVQDCSSRMAKCYLYITYDGEPYLGTLLFDDPSFCAFLAAFLKTHIGERIEDIAALDISQTF